ncbi:MAG: LLM class flavin-dependent oxidoreductase [Deltaproteobacteria bacterium]|nr:LLM class flavin-dependent oxidoreductase [Deltaproteobacteria bacterium]
MEFGLYLRSFLTDRSRSLHEQIDDVVEICHVVRDCGFAGVAMPQHWVSHPTIWPQPFQMLARLAPETGSMRLLTGILLLPLHNPLQVAEDAATLDHVSKGRFVLGVGLGYRDTELEAVGATRKDRVPRLTESIRLMKELWTGEEIDFEGKYWTVHKAKMGFVSLQKPHPPIWMACQSEGAVRRAARIANACYLAPQIGFNDLDKLISIYRDERARTNQDQGRITISRGVSFASSRQAAIQEAQEAAESSYRTYRTWNMQENAMVKINIDADSQVGDWAVAGGPDDCVEGFRRLADKGVSYVNMTMLNLPKAFGARKDFLQRFADNVIRRVNS